MKKRMLYAASVAALALTACTSEEYLGGIDSQGANTTIGFGSGLTAVTRAQHTGTSAAEKLNNNFIVYGTKTVGSAEQTVFKLYNVNYEAGSANTTESNTAGWEYVSFANHDGSINPQTIKYWDHSASQYVFSAVSGTGITATKITSGTDFEKGWNVSIPAGGSLSDLYASDLKIVNNKADYNKQVDLTFRALGTKIRFAIYETVPGYSVHIDRFWTGDVTTPYSDSNFEIKGAFKTANATTPTLLKITYYDTPNDIKYRPKVTFDNGDVTPKTYGEFGANIQATPELGTTSAEATYDQSDKSYTMILPYESNSQSPSAENILKLKVNYTLTSTDGSEETIKVYGATAYVPTQYTQWKPNYAYTYIFKISDKTNGTTQTPSNPDDPNDPAYKDPDDSEYNPNDPAIGLSPITFDAVVITDDTDVQETITSVSEASITTYMNGKVVTENDEYTAGDIYVTVMKGGIIATGTTKIFEVQNNGTIENIITEAVTENYLNNYCTLTPVEATSVTAIPCSDGTTIAGNALKFAGVSGKTYAVQYQYAAATTTDPAKYTYKIIKVSGSASAPTYSLTDAVATEITTVAGTHTLTLKQGSTEVLGAVPNFTITSTNGNNGLKIAEAGNGEYTVSVDPDAVAAGKANDTYTVKYDTKTVTITVNISYSLTPSSVTIAAGNITGATTILKIDGTEKDGDVTEVPDGITITKTATGTYQVTADASVAHGAYTAKIAGQALTINVDSYSFTGNLTITKALTGTSTGDLTLQKNGAAATGVTTLTGSQVAIATFTATDGVYTFTAVAGGSFDVTYENAKATVTVNAYSIDTPASIKKATGIAMIDVKCNGSTINANTNDLELKSKPDVSYADKDEYNAAKGTELDADAFAALPAADKIKTPAKFTVTTDGKSIKFSGASLAGDYTFKYKVDTDEVAEVTITVTE